VGPDGPQSAAYGEFLEAVWGCPGPEEGYYWAMFTAVYQKCGEWWAAYVEEIPGVNTQGSTLEEARENLQEALQMVLAANRELARRQEPADCIREPVVMPA